jgi:hypothetical protein
LKLLAAILLAAAVPALASPIEGIIGFSYSDALAIDYGYNVVTGLDAPNGSYTYDPASGLFTDFSVVWGKATFDLTSSANAPSLATDPPTGCSSAVSGQPYGFSLIAKSVTGCDPEFYWSGLYYGALGYSTFQFVLQSELSPLIIAIDRIDAESFFSANSSVYYETADGAWNPEPGTISMMLLGAAAAALVKAARAARRRA